MKIGHNLSGFCCGPPSLPYDRDLSLNGTALCGDHAVPNLPWILFRRGTRGYNESFEIDFYSFVLRLL